jgi:hypothetical protein
VSTCGGLGLSAVSTFWFLTVGLVAGPRFVVADALMWCGIGAVAWWWTLRREPEPPVPQTREPADHFNPMDWLVRGLFAVIVLATLVTVIRGYLVLPHGDWDAWAIWNQKARFLYRGGDHWTDLLTIAWSQPAHPLLLPLLVTRIWAYAGAELAVVPAMLGVLFGLAVVTVVLGALDPRRRRSWIAGAVLLTPGTFVQAWTAQQADVPFAFYMVASLVAIGYARSASRAGVAAAPVALLVAGGLAGLAAWTKNEGALLLCLTALLMVTATARQSRVRAVIWWTAGVVPPALTLLWFKTVLTPAGPYYLPEGPLFTLLTERLASPEHRHLIDTALWQHWMSWGGPAAAGAVPLVTVAAVCVALSRTGSGARSLLAVPAGMLLGFYIIYLVTSLDAGWLIATTFHRLLSQLWPSLVLIAFLHREVGHSSWRAVADIPSEHVRR